MANPNSLLTGLRFRVCRWLEPYPDKGEAWCMNCTLNGGRTLIMNATGHTEHVEQHRDDSGRSDSNIAIRVNYGYIPVED